MEIVHQSDSSLTSESSFPSGRNRSGHDSSISNEDIKKEERISSGTIPRIMKNNMVSDAKHQSAVKRGFKGLLRPRNWPNPFVQGRYEKIS